MTEHIDPQYIGDLIKGIGLDTYHQYGGSTKDYHKMSRREREEMSGMTKIVGEAITKGLILAKKQPELADAHIQYLESMRQGYTQQLLDDILELYQRVLYFKTFVDK